MPFLAEIMDERASSFGVAVGSTALLFFIYYRNRKIVSSPIQMGNISEIVSKKYAAGIASNAVYKLSTTSILLSDKNMNVCFSIVVLSF